jgi:hypothetical protein
MGGACSVCKGKSSEAPKKAAFTGIAEDGSRIPRIWYEPTVSGGIQATDREGGIRRIIDMDGDKLHDGEEDETRLEEWRQQQNAAVEVEKKELAAKLAAEETLNSETVDEDKILEAKRIIAEYDAKKAKEAEDSKQAQRVAKARDLHEAETARLEKKLAQKRADSRTTSKTDANTLVEEAKVKAEKWLNP